jgi:hypothetical protein
MRVFPESSPKDMYVVLEAEMQTGRSGWSQVFAGRLTIGTRTCDIVVKLYHECMFQDPSASDFYGSEIPGEWLAGIQVAQIEAWAYEKL